MVNFNEDVQDDLGADEDALQDELAQLASVLGIAET